MIQINDKQKCCGCTACFSACGRKAIQMMADEEGFLYPRVDRSMCVGCGRCEDVCPIINKSIPKEEETVGWILRNKDERIVADSTSGGAFTLFAEYLIEKGYDVYGTGYDHQMKVVYKKTTTVDGLSEMRGSKFVQSQLGSTLYDIREGLKKQKKILFTGTPCQVAGLISFLGEKPDNLICIDFVCRGVPSPALWENYVGMMEKRFDSIIVDVKFKNKTYGYHATTMKVTFENGKTWYGSGRIDPMMKAFVNEMSSRPSCHECAFKGVKRLSDITMFDCYSFSNILGIKDDEKGYSSLLVHSEKGKRLLEETREKAILYSVPVEDLIRNNGIMVSNSAKPSSQRSKFYSLASCMSIDKAMNEVNPITLKDHIIEKSKVCLYKTGLIRMAKRIKRERIQIND